MLKNIFLCWFILLLLLVVMKQDILAFFLLATFCAYQTSENEIKRK